MTNKYRIWYDAIIARARTRTLYGYYERHHIVPTALGGGNEKKNLVKLTYREHFLVHWLLVKFTKGQDQMRMEYALWYMARRSGSRIVAGWQYAIAKQAQREARKKHSLSAEARQRIGRAFKGKVLTAEHRRKIGEASRNRSVETRRRIGEYSRNRPAEVLQRIGEASKRRATQQRMSEIAKIRWGARERR